MTPEALNRGKTGIHWESFPAMKYFHLFYWEFIYTMGLHGPAGTNGGKAIILTLVFWMNFFGSFLGLNYFHAIYSVAVPRA